MDIRFGNEAHQFPGQVDIFGLVLNLAMALDNFISSGTCFKTELINIKKEYLEAPLLHLFLE